MRIVRENLNEFHRSGDILDGLNLGIANKIFNYTRRLGKIEIAKTYSSDGWMGIIKYLLSKYEPHIVLEILYSKIPRWSIEFRDNEDSDEPEDQFFIDYVENGPLAGIIDRFIDREIKNKEDVEEEAEKELQKIININENVSAPFSTLTNTPGMGNAIPGGSSNGGIGSGDLWGGIGKQKKKKRVYVKKKKSLKEDSINPHDKLGVALAKKMKVPLYFKKGKGKKDIQQKDPKK